MYDYTLAEIKRILAGLLESIIPRENPFAYFTLILDCLTSLAGFQSPTIQSNKCVIEIEAPERGAHPGEHSVYNLSI